MNAISAILSSEKGLLGVLILIAATVLAALGAMTIQQWIDMTQIIFGTYIVGKTAQGIAQTIKGKADSAKAPGEEA